MIVWLSWAVGGVMVLIAALLIIWALFWDRARGRRRWGWVWVGLLLMTSGVAVGI